MQWSKRVLFSATSVAVASSLDVCNASQASSGLCATGSPEEHFAFVQRHAVQVVAPSIPSEQSTSQTTLETLRSITSGGKSLVCTASGDPHFSMFVGVKHHFQGIGEFVLAASRDASFQVHTCMQQPKGASQRRSMNTMVAVRVPGCMVVCVKGEDCIKVGECTVEVEVTSSSVIFATGVTVVRGGLRSSAVEVKVPAQSYQDNLEGLCGAYSFPRFDDTFTNACGEVVPAFSGGPSGAAYDAFVKNFANTWKVDPGALSLFPEGACAPEPEATDTGTPTEDTPKPFADCEGLRTQAEAACAGDNFEECMDDIGVTCDLSDWAQEATFANAVSHSSDVERPKCTFDITGTPSKYGKKLNFQWTGPCGTTFSPTPVANANCHNKRDGMKALSLDASSGEFLGILSCANQEWLIDVGEPVITPLDNSTASPTPALSTAAPTPTPVIFTTMCKQRTAVPTPDPTTAPTAAPASASGDPHLSNTRGEKFDIYKSGEMEFLRVPSDSAIKDANFTVIATIEKESGASNVCQEKRWIKTLLFGGTWLGDRQVHVTMEKQHMIVLLGGVPVEPSSEQIGVSNHGVLSWLERPKDRQFSLVVNGETRIDVSGHYQGWGSAASDNTYLNMDASSLWSLGHSIGGLLGEDDHADISKRPWKCDHENAAKELIALRAASPNYASARIWA